MRTSNGKYVLAALLSVASLTYGEAFAVSVVSVEYTESTGTLTITVDEPILETYAEGITLLDDHGGTVALDVGSTSHSENSPTILIVLDDTSAFEALLHPRYVAIAANGIQTVNNNTNSDTITHHITYDDATPPTISSAAYSTISGTLVVSVSLSESVVSSCQYPPTT